MTKPASKPRLLSAAMWRALEDFADAGGHGYGEYAHLSKRTAQALQRRGLVELGHRDLGGGRYMAWGHATVAGRERLRQHRQQRAAGAWKQA